MKLCHKGTENVWIMGSRSENLFWIPASAAFARVVNCNDIKTLKVKCKYILANCKPILHNLSRALRRNSLDWTFLDIGDLQMINEYLKLANQSGSENWRWKLFRYCVVTANLHAGKWQERTFVTANISSREKML